MKGGELYEFFGQNTETFKIWKNTLQYCFCFLHYSIVNGKMHFSSDLQQMPIEELLRLRSMPNGRMDLLTVDESVRLNANMMVQFDGMLDDLLNNQ